MIIREPVNGETLVVGQTEHSRFVGQLAAHWGNGEVARPEPWESVVRAAIYHDYGWITYETSPLVSEQSGEPYRFLELPLEQRQLDSYQWCIDWMAATDVYAALIISRHRTGLWQGRYGVMRHPQRRYDLHQLDRRIVELIERNEAWQDKVLASIDPRSRARLPANSLMLQGWDLLGLYFCTQQPYEYYTDPIPTGREDEAGRMTMKPAGERVVLFDPYLFDEPGLRVQLACKRLPQRKYATAAQFREAYFKAPNALLEYELRPA